VSVGEKMIIKKGGLKMKDKKFLVTFITGQCEIVYADSSQSASILAQAKQIKKDNSYKISKVMQIKRY